MIKLEAKNITKSYDNKKILDNLSLTLNKEEILCVLGASGAGKTTLFHILSGLVPPDQGEVFLNGQEITSQTGKVSYMLQKDLLLPYRTVLDNVILPLLIRGEKKKEARDKAAVFFEEFGLEGTEKKYPSQLSGGMRQRAALLRTYLFSDEVALLDEPFSALDTITKRKMHNWYLNVMEKIKLSTIMITHDIDEAILLSNRILIMKGQPGRIVEEIKIDQNEQRDLSFALKSSFLEYKKRILKIL